MTTSDDRLMKISALTRRPAWADAFVLSGLAVLVGLAFWEVLFGGRVFFFRDFSLFFYPKRVLVAESIRHWQVPFWDSMGSCGEPVLGTYQTAVFYPLAIIYYLLPMPASFMWFVVLHFFVSGAGAYYMMRVWGARRIAAAFTAVAWAFSPAFVSTLDYVSFQTALSWMPWCLAFARRITNGSRLGGFIWLSLALTMAVLAAAPEPVIFIVVLLYIYAVWSAASAARSRGWSAAWKPAALIAAAPVLAVVLSGVEIVPFIHTLSYSARQDRLLLKDAGRWSATPSDALLMLLPRFYVFPDRGGIYWRSQYWLKTVYLGALVPFLAAWTFVCLRRSRRLVRPVVAAVIGAAAAFGLVLWTRGYMTPQALAESPFSPMHKAVTLALGGLIGWAFAATRRRNVFFAAAAIPFLLLAVGPASGFWKFCYDHVPGFGLIRYPVKFYLPAAFAIAVLAGFAVDDFLVLARRGPKRVPAVLITGILVAAILFTASWAAMTLKPEAVYKLVTPASLLARGEAGVEQAADCYEATQWSFGRSAAALGAGAAALLLAAFMTRRRIPRPYGAIAIAAVLFADAGFYGAHLNPIAGSYIYTENPARIVMVPHGLSDTRLFMTADLRLKLYRQRLARIKDLDGLRNYVSLVKGVRFDDDSQLLQWLERTSAPRFSTVQELDAWLKSGGSDQFITDVEYEVLKETFYPNINMFYGVSEPDGFEPLAVKWHHDLYMKVIDKKLPEDRVRFLSRLWGVSVVMESLPQLPAFVYLPMEKPGTRAVLADRVISVENDAEAEFAVADSAIDVLQRIVLFRSDADAARQFLGPAASEAPAADAAAPGAARVTFDSGNRSTFQVTAAKPALLFVADNYFPNFTATVDGKPAPLWRANYGYRAVPVDAGEHTVEFIWRPYDFYAGLAATLIGVIALIAAAWVSRRMRNIGMLKNPTEGQLT